MIDNTRSLLRIQLLGASVAVVGIAGCSFAPDSNPPLMPLPQHYSVAAQPAHTVAAQGMQQTFDANAAPVAEWWKLYRSDALDALVDEGLRNSPNLAAADQTLKASREQLKGQLASSLLPSVDLAGLAARLDTPGVPQLGSASGLYDLFLGQVQVRYTFDLFGATRLADVARAARFNSEAWQFDAARRALAANIVTGAIGAAALGKQIETTERLIALADDNADDTQMRYRLGAVSHTEALNDEQEAASLAASLPALRARWMATRHALAVLIGRRPDQAPPDLDFVQLKVPQDVPVVVPSVLLATRPDVQAADALLKAASADVGVATAQLFPSLSLSASWGKGGLTGASALAGTGTIWSVGAALTQPIFHGGALFAERRAAQRRYEAAIDLYRQTVLGAFRNVADTLVLIEQDSQALSNAEKASRASARAFAEATERVRFGALPEAAERASERRYRNAELSVIQYAGARLTDTTALFQAMGSPCGGASSPGKPRADARQQCQPDHATQPSN